MHGCNSRLQQLALVYKASKKAKKSEEEDATGGDVELFHDLEDALAVGDLWGHMNDGKMCFNICLLILFMWCG